MAVAAIPPEPPVENGEGKALSNAKIDDTLQNEQPPFQQLLLKCISLINEADHKFDTKITNRALRISAALRCYFDPIEFVSCTFHLMIAKGQPRGRIILEAIAEQFDLVPEKCVISNEEGLVSIDTADLDPRLHLPCKALELCLNYRKQSSPLAQSDDIKSDQILTREPKPGESQEQAQFTKQLRTRALEWITKQNAGKKSVSTASSQDDSGAQAVSYKSLMKSDSLPNIDLFLSFMTMMKLIDRGCGEKGLTLANLLLKEFHKGFQPHVYDDALISKVVFYIWRVYDLCNDSPSLSSFLKHIYQTTKSHHYLITQAASLCLLLKVFIDANEYEQATKFLSTATFPFEAATDGFVARYFYYTSRIIAMRLDYNQAHAKVMQALRHALPEEFVAGKGFRLAATKLRIILELLKGEVPGASIFNNSDLSKYLKPYHTLSQAVKSGDMKKFGHAVRENKHIFEQDRNLVFVNRLHQIVIRGGLRKIAKAYSRISLDDVVTRLGLDEQCDIESILSKAIADGILHATIDSENRILNHESTQELGTWLEIRELVTKRIESCLQLQNDAIKAMRYASPASQNEPDDAEDRKELQKQLDRAEKEDIDVEEIDF